MSDTTGAAGTAPPEDPSDSQPQRSLFGRLLDALNSNEPDSEAERVIDASVKKVLPGLASLRRLKVEDVAIPKAEIVAIAVDADRDEMIARFRESGFSRLPVYAETLDRPLGLLLLKDLVLQHGFGIDADEIDIRAMLRPLLYVPGSMPLVVLLQKMQTERIHMALMIDEYGGVDGLLTIEDLLEQVVGQIEDEHDTEDAALWQEESPGVWVVQARATLDDFGADAGIDLSLGVEDEDIDTLGGLIFVLAGRVPVRGEVIAHPAGYELEVLEADLRRVKRLRLRRSSDAASDATGDARGDGGAGGGAGDERGQGGAAPVSAVATGRGGADAVAAPRPPKPLARVARED